MKNPGGPYPYVSASDIPLSSRAATDPAPRPLTHEEIEEYIKQFGQAAKNAITAGFDGVEIHGAHGYLVDQFIQTNTNKREDQWGGNVKGQIQIRIGRRRRGGQRDWSGEDSHSIQSMERLSRSFKHPYFARVD